mmetsp:Transcript_18078/g.50221  ORF Transcript_18078/g.50221 Transcript_18078/m.50221 type:complete len:96 (+) Transcript_18078:675-962(+)
MYSRVEELRKNITASCSIRLIIARGALEPPVCSSRCMHWQNRKHGNLPYDSNYTLLRIIVSTIGFADRHQLLMQKQTQPPKRKAKRFYGTHSSKL